MKERSINSYSRIFFHKQLETYNFTLSLVTLNYSSPALYKFQTIRLGYNQNIFLFKTSIEEMVMTDWPKRSIIRVQGGGEGGWSSPSDGVYSPTAFFNIPDHGCNSAFILEGGSGQGSAKIHIPPQWKISLHRYGSNVDKNFYFYIT